MNPLTQVKNTQKITAREAALGVSDAGSWHAKYKDSAYIYAGNFSFDLTEGDLLAIFAQYGEIVDVNLVRDKGTGKSRGFAFLAYEDQRSTILAVDNLNGASIAGRIIKVDHVANYKRKAEEDEEEEQRKREERGVCRSFQRGECTRGSACRFSHNEQRCADTGWGGSNSEPSWAHDKYDGSSQKHHKRKEEVDRKFEDRFKHRVDKEAHVDNGKQNFDSDKGDGKYYNDKDRYDKSRNIDDDRRHDKYMRDDYKRIRRDDERTIHKSVKSTLAHSSDDESYRNEGQKTDRREKIDDRERHGYGKRDRKNDRSREHGQRSDGTHDKRNERELKKSRGC